MEPPFIELLMSRFEKADSKIALIVDGNSIDYRQLRLGTEAWQRSLSDAGIQSGSVVLLRGDFTADSVSALLALLRIGAISILLAPVSDNKADEYKEIGQAEFFVCALQNEVKRLSNSAEHPLYGELRAIGEPGIVLFSSGSTGSAKGTVHSGARLLEKFRPAGKDLRTLAFLLFDHIAGFDTLFYCLANTSTLVLPSTRSPQAIAQLIQYHSVEVLPAAPSFLNLFLLSGAAESYDLSSLKIITYGSEMMPDATLANLGRAFPNVALLQKYGTSETGALPARSEDSSSRWLKLGAKGFEWRVREDMLEIKAKTSMLGYLNAPSPFTDDGWFQTQDKVEVRGEYLRFLGRQSDIINIGGQKVFPAEVEALILGVEDVIEAAVFGKPHAILGSIVVARIHASADADHKQLRQKIRSHLSSQLETFKVPQKFEFTDHALTSERFKQIRRTSE